MLPRSPDGFMKPAVRQLLVGRSGRLNIANYSVSNPLYIAHRGGALMYPEETTEGYRASVLAGNLVQEQDVQMLADGAMGVMHDPTVDRTTTGTGAVNTFTSATWQALAIDANTVNGSNFGNALVPPLMTNLLAEFGNRVIWTPEAKSGGSGLPLARALSAAGIKRSQVILQSAILAELAPGVAAGYEAAWLSSSATPATEIANAQAAGVRWVALDMNLADSVISQWVAAGFKTIAYTVNRRSDRDRLLALGVMGFFSDDPQYLAASGPIYTSDNFKSGTWMPGMFSHNSGIVAVERGQFTAPDMWGLPLNTNVFNSVLQGWACPIKNNVNADTYTLDFKVTHRTVNLADATRFFTIHFNKTDKAYADGTAPTAAEQGFVMLGRKNGSIEIWKRTTAAVTQVAVTATVAIADNEEVSYRIVVTPTAVSFHRVNGSGTITHTATFSDSDPNFRGGYMHFCRNGLGADFRSVSIS